MPDQKPLETTIVAVPETAGSALYGMLDVLNVTGNVWQALTRTEPMRPPFRVQVVGVGRERFCCGNGIPVEPGAAIDEVDRADIVILPELWLGPDEHLKGRYPALIEWIRARYEAGACVYSACSGALMLAETGLLDGRDATSHWGYQDLFKHQYPQVRFRPEPNLCFADQSGRIVTAGGTTSWHDLALHIISRHVSPGEAMRIAKVYLLKWHDEGQLPYGPLVRQQPHSDAAVRGCERWLGEHFRESGAVARAVGHARIPERTLKRRFKHATGLALIDYLQNLRIEEAKRLLESSDQSVDEIGFEIGYEDSSFFRRLFKRRTGIAPAQYRRVFQPIHRTLPAVETRRRTRA
ncbi:MAG TPA: helix-turn-helix domain-containing protein [Vicinamibacterales bacterium]|jgi:transcriptional regulator GlxA family with amidase domain|nr:helix-turn-helix domain-containing protein [Vicinamibacterales bacterium]